MRRRTTLAILLALAPAVQTAAAPPEPAWLDVPPASKSDDPDPVIRDFLSHCRSPKFRQAGRHDYVHEASHLVASDLRVAYQPRVAYPLGTKIPIVNGVYVGGGRGLLFVEPWVRLTQVGALVPPALRGSRFAHYFGKPGWDSAPLYVVDEWTAYANEAAHHLALAEAGGDVPASDVPAAALEFAVYALALKAAVDKHDPGYYLCWDEPLLGYLAWNWERSVGLFRWGQRHPRFEQQAAYFDRVRADPFVVRGVRDLGLDPDRLLAPLPDARRNVTGK